MEVKLTYEVTKTMEPGQRFSYPASNVTVIFKDSLSTHHPKKWFEFFYQNSDTTRIVYWDQIVLVFPQRTHFLKFSLKFCCVVRAVIENEAVQFFFAN